MHHVSQAPKECALATACMIADLDYECMRASWQRHAGTPWCTPYTAAYAPTRLAWARTISPVLWAALSRGIQVHGHATGSLPPQRHVLTVVLTREGERWAHAVAAEECNDGRVIVYDPGLPAPCALFDWLALMTSARTQIECLVLDGVTLYDTKRREGT